MENSKFKLIVTYKILPRVIIIKKKLLINIKK